MEESKVGKKCWITTYAISKKKLIESTVVDETDYQYTCPIKRRGRNKGEYRIYIHKCEKCVFFDKSEAIKKAEKMRDDRIKSLEKQLVALRYLTFK